METNQGLCLKVQGLHYCVIHVVASCWYGPVRYVSGETGVVVLVDWN